MKDTNGVSDDNQEERVVEERWDNPGQVTRDQEHRNAQQKVVVGSECPQVAVKKSLQVRLKEIAEDESAVRLSEP